MSSIFGSNQVSSEPENYVEPEFPSLYWPFPWQGPQSKYLYTTPVIWRFTLYWTFIFFATMHFAAAGYAIVNQWRNWKTIWMTPVVFGFIGGLEALVGGSIVGGLLGAIYNAGSFSMSTWVPFVWAAINALTVILSSFSIQGGL